MSDELRDSLVAEAARIKEALGLDSVIIITTHQDPSADTLMIRGQAGNYYAIRASVDEYFRQMAAYDEMDRQKRKDDEGESE